MDKDSYVSELWEDLKQVYCNILYLDRFRANKAVIEPVYKGIVGFIAIITAVASFINVSYLTEIASVFTALGVVVPLLFPVLPSAAVFSKMATIRCSLKDRLTELEDLWCKERGEKEYREYREGKKRYASVETELSAIFGKINEKWNALVIEDCNRYLDHFTSFS
jgi:ABC-type transport system involved in cytochrome bd biosynthesis fused ATPase/permease subunit